MRALPPPHVWPPPLVQANDEDPFRERETPLLDLAKIIHSEEDAAIFLIEQGVIEVSGSGYGRRGTHKAGHTQGGAHKRRSIAVQESCYLRGVQGAGPRVERSEPNA